MDKTVVDNLRKKFDVLFFDDSKFEDSKKLGSGGFGTVYITKYKQLKIAVKDPNDESKVVQLEKEIANVIALRHVNIPKLYGISNSLTLKNGASIAIEYVNGLNFTDYKKYNPSTIEIISHLIELTTTLEYIHSCGVIHRDLKPDNFMIEISNLSVKLLDFGISRRTLHEETKTVVVGTPIYMAPENYDIVFGTGASTKLVSIMKISPKVDIWALGIIINQLISGEYPWAKYKGTDVSVLFIKGIKFPISEKIKDDDIKQLIASCTEPFANKRCSIAYVKKQLMKILTKLSHNLKFEDLKNSYIESLKEKDKLYILLLRKIERQLKHYYYLLHLEKESLKTLTVTNTHTLTKHLGTVTNVVYIRDYDKESIISISMDKSMLVWDINSGKCKKEFKKHSGGLLSIVHLRDLGSSKAHVAVGSEDKKIYVWDLNAKSTEKPSYELNGHSGAVDCLFYLREYSPDMLASGSRDKSIKLWKVAANKNTFTLIGHNDKINSMMYLACFPNIPNAKNVLVSFSSDNTIKAWSLVNGKVHKNFPTPQGHQAEITCYLDNIKYSEKNDVFATGSKDGTIKLWEYSKESCLLTLTAHENGVNCLISLKEYDPTWIASGGVDHSIKIWDLAKEMPCISTLIAHEGGISSMVFLKEVNRELLASGSDDCSIKIWNFVNSQLIMSIDEHKGGITSLLFLDGYSPSTMVSTDNQNIIKVWRFAV